MTDGGTEESVDLLLRIHDEHLAFSVADDLLSWTCRCGYTERLADEYDAGSEGPFHPCRRHAARAVLDAGWLDPAAAEQLRTERDALATEVAALQLDVKRLTEPTTNEPVDVKIVSYQAPTASGVCRNCGEPVWYNEPDSLSRSLPGC
jgi:hypothetical protein